METSEIGLEPTASDHAEEPAPPSAEERPEGPVRILAYLKPGHVAVPERPERLPDPEVWRQLAEQYPGIGARWPFAGILDRGEVREIAAAAFLRDPPGRSPLSLIEVTVPADLVATGVDLEALVERIVSFAVVDVAYLSQADADLPQVVNAPTQSLLGEQTYLSPAPNGVDAVYASAQAGGNAAGITIVDAERAWWPPPPAARHPDLPSPINHLAGAQENNASWRQHGTNVLGVLAGLDNGQGVVGIASGATVCTIGTMIGAPPGYRRVEVAITEAAKMMARGDVLLIEEQLVGKRPVELEEAIYEAIADTTWRLGIVVVEPAANGGRNLDRETCLGKYRLARCHPEFRDSGAIMVGAGTARPVQEALPGSNYGSRVDCFAQGEDVVTTDTSAPSYYTQTFSGTSSAGAIVAGSAAVVQGWVRSRRPMLDSRQMRWVLSTYATVRAGGPHPIGGMPDIRRILAAQAWGQIPTPLVYK